MLMPTIGKKQGKTNKYIKWKTTGVYNKNKRSIIALREEINPLDDNKKIDNILMKSRMYVMYVSKNKAKVKIKKIRKKG